MVSLTELPRRYVARERLCLRGTTDYWINGLGGAPFFVLTQPVNPGLIAMLRQSIVPRLLAQAPQPTSKRTAEAAGDRDAAAPTVRSAHLKYRRLRARLGAPKAIVAMAHHLARLVYRMLRYGQNYVEQSIHQYKLKFQLQGIKWLKKEAKSLNLQLLPA
jgi:hypothetical protein